jgi:hypothetical protein
MSDYSRAPYTPGSEPPLAFDDRRPPRRSGPAPVTLILSLLLLAAVGGGVFYIYRGGARAPGEPPQPVGAPVRDVRIAAPPQAQTTDPAAGLSVYKDDQGAGVAAPAFVAPPEQPTPRPVVAAVAPAPAPVPSAGAVSASTQPAVAAPPAKAPVKAADKPPTIDKILADNAALKSPPKAPTKSAARAGPAAVAKADTPPAAASDAKAGPAVVQIGAFSSKELADSSWNSAAGAAPGAMAGKGKHVTTITRPDGTTLYRAAITGFASRDDALALCARLKASGGTCIVR